MKARDRRLQALREQIHELAPAEAHAQQQAGAVLVDVRGPDEVAQGLADGAIAIERGFLELRIETHAPQLDQPVLLMCASGQRSLFAAEALLRMGYTQVGSVRGGFDAWKDAGLPFHRPQVLDAALRARYARQMILPEVGEAGQRKLLEARVLLVGAGGLGAPAALYLAAAGVGTLGLIDHDTVDLGNLHRQVIHTSARVGQDKVASARDAIAALNPAVRVVPHAVRLSADNAEALFADYDVVIDGTDNFQARYLINDACVRLGLPDVHGSVYRFDGQVSVFWPAGPAGGPCYRCLYPAPPPPALAPSCSEAGVLGVLPGVVGLLQATEALKLVLGIGQSLAGRLLYFDALDMQFRSFRVQRNPDCSCCAAPPAAGQPAKASASHHVEH